MQVFAKLFSTYPFSVTAIDESWANLLSKACANLAPTYIKELASDPSTWLPGSAQIFNAFSLPLPEVQYILFGESPYPRARSANGYAFWDAAVDDLWSSTGLAKPVNRATSLRNFIKMLLVASGHLAPDNTSQAAIAHLAKQPFIQTNPALFNQLLQQGFLLLNASLVLRSHKKNYDADQWLPFIACLLEELAQHRPGIRLLLFGKIANTIKQLPASRHYSLLEAEHPYNLSFIQNKTVLDFFRPLNLLQEIPYAKR